MDVFVLRIYVFTNRDSLFPLSVAYIKRVIAHPNFHNISFNQAEKMMESLDQGDLIIRPSSKGENHLTVTWKVRQHHRSWMTDEIRKIKTRPV